MAFELVDSISLAGDAAKPNEDAFGHSSHAALVLDGATGLGENLLPGESDAAWLARFGAWRLLAHLEDGASAQDALAHALVDAEKSFAGLRRRAPQEKWEIPYASMMLVTESQARLPRARDGASAGEVPVAALAMRRAEGEEIEFLWLGDCGALAARPGAGVEMIGESLAKRAARLAAEKNLTPASGLHRAEFITHLRAARNRVNSGREWLFSPDARAATHAGKKRIAAPAGTLILLATDGFLALVSDYRCYDAASLLAAARAKGLKALGEELRAIEEADKDGAKFPRFKQSDDSTVLLLRVV